MMSRLSLALVSDKLAGKFIKDRTDDPMLDQYKAIIAGSVGSAAIPLAVGLPTALVTPKIAKDEARGKALIEGIAKGYSEGRAKGLNLPSIEVVTDPKLARKLTFQAGGAGFSPVFNHILVTERTAKAPAIVAHEYGHALDAAQGGMKRIKRGLNLMKYGAVPVAALGGYFALNTNDDDLRKKIVAGSSLAAAGLTLPNLYSEAKASWLGLRHLKKLVPEMKLGRSRLALAAALGTYGTASAAIAAMPWITAKTQDMIRENRPWYKKINTSTFKFNQPWYEQIKDRFIG